MIDDQQPVTPPDDAELKDLLSEIPDPLSLPPSTDVEVTEVEPVVEPEPGELVQAEPQPVAEPAPEIGELQRLVGRFKSVADTVLADYNADRAKIEQAINYLDSIVQMGPKAPRVYVEMWIAAIRTKAETTTNAVKLLDSLAKLLSAGKGTNIFVGQQTINTTDDLSDILNTPEFPDEK